VACAPPGGEKLSHGQRMGAGQPRVGGGRRAGGWEGRTTTTSKARIRGGISDLGRVVGSQASSGWGGRLTRPRSLWFWFFGGDFGGWCEGRTFLECGT